MQCVVVQHHSAVVGADEVSVAGGGFGAVLDRQFHEPGERGGATPVLRRQDDQLRGRRAGELPGIAKRRGSKLSRGCGGNGGLGEQPSDRPVRLAEDLVPGGLVEFDNDLAAEDRDALVNLVEAQVGLSEVILDDSVQREFRFGILEVGFSLHDDQVCAAAVHGRRHPRRAALGLSLVFFPVEAGDLSGALLGCFFSLFL